MKRNVNSNLPLCLLLITLATGVACLNPVPAVADDCRMYPYFEQSQVHSLELPTIYVSSLALQGSLAYLAGMNHGFQIIDVTHPLQPQLLCHVQHGMYILNNSPWVVPGPDLVFLCGAVHELPVFDTSDPTDPQLLVELDIAEEVTAVAYGDDLLYVASWGYGTGPERSVLQIFDFTTPTAPVELNFIVDNHSFAHCAELHGDVLLLSASSGLHAFDISDPLSVKQLSVYTSGYAPRVMHRIGDLLYSVDWDEHLRILDVSDPTNITELGSTDLRVYGVYDIHVQDSTAMVFCGSSGVRLVDVTDPTSPSMPTAWPSTDFCYGGFIDGPHFCLLGSGELKTAERVATEPLTSISYQSYSYRPEDLALVGDLLYVVDGSLEIQDISDPANPVTVGTFDGGGHYKRLALDGTVAYLACWSTGVVAVDVSDPANPVQLSTVSTIQAYSVAAADDRVYVGPRSGNMFVYDVTKPEAPLFLGAHTSDGTYRAYGIDVEGSHVYLNSMTMRVLDVSNPADIKQVASLPAGGSYGAVVNENLIFVPGSDEIQIMQFTPPTTLEVLSSVYIPTSIEDIFYRDEIVYVVDDFSGVNLIDVSVPAAPVRLGVVPARNAHKSVVASEQLIIVGSADSFSLPGGLEIWPQLCQLSPVAEPTDQVPVSPLELAAYPNPFNPLVRLEFEVAVPGRAELAIYDVQGRRVQRLLHGIVSAGRQHFNWNGQGADSRPMASGAYLARLQVGEQTTSRLVTLVR